MTHPSIIQTVLPPIAIGAPVRGGFFAGFLVSGDIAWGLAVAPKAAGEICDAVWHPSRTDVPGATSCHDGLANTLALAEAGSPLAQQILQLKVNECDDWYLPARDELELLYRAFKPSTQPNDCSFRDGDNASSVPVGYPYTPQQPAQSAIAAFQVDGPEAFALDWYWSSTQFSHGNAFYQDFYYGSQGIDLKSAAGLARAVRRFSL